MERGKVQDFTFYSKELNEQIEIYVYLPPQYTPLYKYSYVIAQDGKDYFQLGRIPRTLDELLNDGEIEPIIFFGVPYKDVDDRRKKYHPSGAKHKEYIRFLVNELVPFIEENFPVLHMGQARALAGDSLAATISLLTAIQYPHTFGKLILHSPFVNDTVLAEAANFTNWQLITAYHTIGLQETEVHMTHGEIGDFLTPNRELANILNGKSFDYYYSEFEGNHTWTYWQKDLKKALKLLF